MLGEHLLHCAAPQKRDTRAQLCGNSVTAAAARLPLRPSAAVAACEGAVAGDMTPQLAIMTSYAVLPDWLPGLQQQGTTELALVQTGSAVLQHACMRVTSCPGCPALPHASAAFTTS